MTNIKTRTMILAALAALGLASALPAASQARAHHASAKTRVAHTITATKTPTTTILAIRKGGPLGPIVHVNLPVVKSALTAGGAGILATATASAKASPATTTRPSVNLKAACSKATKTAPTNTARSPIASTAR